MLIIILKKYIYGWALPLVVKNFVEMCFTEIALFDHFFSLAEIEDIYSATLEKRIMHLNKKKHIKTIKKISVGESTYVCITFICVLPKCSYFEGAVIFLAKLHLLLLD